MTRGPVWTRGSEEKCPSLRHTVVVVVAVAAGVVAAAAAAVDLGFRTLLTAQAISVDLNSVREKSDKFCSEHLISA